MLCVIPQQRLSPDLQLTRIRGNLLPVGPVTSDQFLIMFLLSDYFDALDRLVP